MSHAARNPQQPVSTPSFEALEDRLMLTMLYNGEWFIYRNSQDEAVRVSLDAPDDPNDPSDPDSLPAAIVELFQAEGAVGLHWVGGDLGPLLGRHHVRLQLGDSVELVLGDIPAQHTRDDQQIASVRTALQFLTLLGR